MSTRCPRTYDLEFSAEKWEEIISMGFEPFEPSPDEPMTRGQWLAIADMALGKAQRIEAGDYDYDEPDFDDATWIEQLRCIAGKIHKEFRPGDGRI